jgi:hypothetical protein
VPRITDATLIQNPAAFKTCFPSVPDSFKSFNKRRKCSLRKQAALKTIDTSISSWVLANFGSDFVSHYSYHVSPVTDEFTPGNRVLEMFTVVQLVSKLSALTKFEGTSPCSQEPAIGTHPEPSKVCLHCFITLRPVFIF